jgi:hypothetical protein
MARSARPPHFSHAPCRNQQNCGKVFDTYELRSHIDDLFAVVNAQKARARSGEAYTGLDAWRNDLPPRTAARARTVPRLEAERQRLRKELDEVGAPSRNVSDPPLTDAQLESQAAGRQAQMQEYVRAKQSADAEAVRVLDEVEAVGRAPYAQSAANVLSDIHTVG